MLHTELAPGFQTFEELPFQLFDRSKKTISEHLQNLFDEAELEEISVIRKFRITAAEGNNKQTVQLYHLEPTLTII